MKKRKNKKFVPSETWIDEHPFLNVNFLLEFFEYFFIALKTIQQLIIVYI